jgi:hypothetical protein
MDPTSQAAGAEHFEQCHWPHDLRSSNRFSLADQERGVAGVVDHGIDGCADACKLACDQIRMRKISFHHVEGSPRKITQNFRQALHARQSPTVPGQDHHTPLRQQETLDNMAPDETRRPGYKDCWG